MSASYRFAINVTPKPGILDPQGRAVEGSLGHLGIDGVSGVRVGRRVELTIAAADTTVARSTVERLARELLCNQLIETFEIEALAAPDGSALGAPDGSAETRAASGGGS